MKPIILLHGAIGAKDQLSELSKKLSLLNFNVYSLNFSGHGNEDFKNNFSIEQFSIELKEFINKHKIEKPNIFGYSMGGYVALYLAFINPDLINTIITLGTKFEWTPEIAEKETKMLNPKTIIEKVPKFADALINRHGKNWELLLSKTEAMMTALGNKNALSINNFSQIKNKVLVGIGDKDNMVSLEETINVYKQLSNGQMYMLPNTKHPIETVNYDLLSKIIAETI
jgi:esterase/lipase